MSKQEHTTGLKQSFYFNATPFPAMGH